MTSSAALANSSITAISVALSSLSKLSNLPM